MSSSGNNNGGWGQPPQNGNQGWGQPPQANNNAWGQPPQANNNAWGQPPQANNNAWGQPPQANPNANPWGQPPQANPNANPAPNPWGQPPQGNPNASPAPNPWGQPPQGNPNPNPGQGVLNMNQQTFLTKVFGWMGMGLGLTAVVAFLTYATGLIYVVMPVAMVLFLGELALVWWLSSRWQSMNPSTAVGAFLGYSALNGLTLSAIFAVYNPISIALTFVGAASMFGFMFVLGITTKRDLGPMGRFLAMMVFGLFIVSLLNLVAGMFGLLGTGTAAMISWGISLVGVFVFAGLTAYDAQKLKVMSERGFASHADETRASIMGALMLYLDFINLFLFLLRLFGGRRD